MLTMEELLSGAKLEDQEDSIQKNLAVLLERVNVIRAAWGKPMTVTSGLRTMAHHLEIYRAKAQHHQAPFRDGVFDESKVPKNSRHLFGMAVDISDPDLELTAWLKENNSQRLVDAGLWCEEGNENWVHFQIVAPLSGNRWFYP